MSPIQRLVKNLTDGPAIPKDCRNHQPDSFGNDTEMQPASIAQPHLHAPSCETDTKSSQPRSPVYNPAKASTIRAKATAQSYHSTISSVVQMRSLRLVSTFPLIGPDYNAFASYPAIAMIVCAKGVQNSTRARTSAMTCGWHGRATSARDAQAQPQRKPNSVQIVTYRRRKHAS